MAKIRLYEGFPVWFTDAGAYLRPATEAEYSLATAVLNGWVVQGHVADKVVQADISKFYDGSLGDEEHQEWLQATKGTTPVEPDQDG